MSDTKEKILDAAEHLFAVLGFKGASLRAITNQADANLGSIHYYFGSKENLVRAVVERRRNQFIMQRDAELRAVVESDQKNLKKIWAMLISTILQAGKKNPDFMIIITRLLLEPGSRYSRILDEVDMDFDEIFIKEVQSFFPPEFAHEVEFRTRLMLELIYRFSLNVNAPRTKVLRLGVELGGEAFIDELADIAAFSMTKFLPDGHRPAD